MNTDKIVAISVAVAEAAAPLDAKEASTHFTIRELTRSATAERLGLDNTPPPQAVESLHRLINEVLEPARTQLGAPIYVNSGYRCPELNRAVGGAARSYHLHGRAADLTTGTVEGNRRLLQIFRQLPHSELLWEQGGVWIHVAL